MAKEPIETPAVEEAPVEVAAPVTAKGYDQTSGAFIA